MSLLSNIIYLILLKESKKITIIIILLLFFTMDDFVLSNLQESRNEWCSRLVSIFTPLVVEGVKSIFNEAWTMCINNSEGGKYLMTFQNLLTRIPKWNSVIIEEERKRIIERSGCNYLEDLITCVHIIQLKVLTCIRVGNKQKKIDIAIPKLDVFIHKVYINVARKAYTNVYLFEKNILPLLMQKNARELEVIVQESILATIRESIPTEAIIRAYMDESIEQEEEVTIEQMHDPVLSNETKSNETKSEDKDSGLTMGSTSADEIKKNESVPSIETLFEDEDKAPSIVPSIQNLDNERVITRLSFNDYDAVLDNANNVESINAPKTLERLDDIATSRALQRKLEEEQSDLDDRIQIHTDSIELNNMDVFDMNKPSIGDDVPLFDFDEL